MSKISWTKEQSQAIDIRGSDVLVNASAGSGKTAVLTERIIKKLLNPASPCNITDFLIVTFTVSAAKELKEKISSAIKNALNDTSTSAIRHLKRQIVNLPSAKILTIDSFCKFIVSECSSDLNIPCDFQIGEETELNQLSAEVLSNLLDECFDGFQYDLMFDTSFLPNSTRKGFDSIVTTFSKQKGFDEMTGIIKEQYAKLLKYPDPFSYIRELQLVTGDILIKKYKNNESFSFFDTVIGKGVIRDVSQAVEMAISYYNEAKALVEPFTEMSAKYMPIIEKDITIATAYLDSWKKGEGNNGTLKVTNNLSPYKPKTTEEEMAKARFRALRDEAKDIIKSISQKYVPQSEEKLFAQLADTFSISNELFSLIQEFHKRLVDEKIKKKVFSFDDISQLAYKALVVDGTYSRTTREFQKTDYAGELSEKFEEILIDEYQDVNELQDTIFKAISNSHNRFMVGDIKQSIYKFRGATPIIFDNYRNTFSPYSEEDASGVPTIVNLQDNFRSDDSVINFVNGLFCKIMNYKNDTVYKNEDFLKCSKKEDGKMHLPTELAILSDDRECEYVADKIVDIVKNNPTTPLSDIAIIARKHESLQKIEKVLAEKNIPTSYSANNSYFKSWEIETVVALLNTVDNPTNDVYLLSSLISPLFSFTPKELLEIREKEMQKDVFFALKRYAENGESDALRSKCDAALKTLNFWFNKSCTAKSDDFIWWLYDETGLLSIASKLDGGKSRKENLLEFYKLAIKFEQSEYKGLKSFLRYVETLQKSKNNLGAKKNSDNNVKLITIHDSKGLEFPYCFYIASSKKINRSDETSPIINSERFGASFAVPSGNLGARVTTYEKLLAASETREENVDEELRLLYVALTRAKNQLFITANADLEKIKAYVDIASLSRKTMAYSIKNADSIFKIIAVGLASNPTFSALLNSSKGDNVSIEGDELTARYFEEYTPCDEVMPAAPKSLDTKPLKIRKEDVDFSMKAMPSTDNTPYKIAVTSLKDGVIDDSSVASVVKPKKAPKFCSGSVENDGAFKGTAMHTFMQFCDFGECIKRGTPWEAERLKKYGFITDEQFEALNHPNLAKFFKSKIFKELSSSNRIEREKRFTISLPSSILYNDEEKKKALDATGANTLVQGVVDLYFFNADGTVTLLDFKTDSVGEKDGEKILKDRHASQLLQYKKAIEEIENCKVAKTVIYSFCLAKEIEIC